MCVMCDIVNLVILFLNVCAEETVIASMKINFQLNQKC